MQRVYVWDVVVRLTHWTIALSIAVLSATGLYIGWPVAGVPGDFFLMGWVRAIHLLAGIAFSIAVLARIAWMFLGRGEARWDRFVPASRQRMRELWQTLAFYLLIRREAPPQVGHNPLAGAAYAGVFGLYLVMVVTGLGMWGVYADVGWLTPFAAALDLVGGPQTARYVHHIVMWLLLGFFVHHLYSALLVSHLEKNGTMESIFSGFKWMRR